MQRVFVMAGVLVFPLSAAAFTGNDLNMLCTKTDTASRSACAAYIEGAADGIYNTIEAIGGTSGPQVGQYFCLPVDVKPQELTDAVRKFIADNPPGVHGIHRYDPAEYGVRPEEVNDTFRSYIERFDLRADA